jgi:hypothetical protein
MSDESQAMRVNVSLDELDVAVLAEVMASMPSHVDGKLRGIGPADALRHALHEHAKTLPTARRGKR